MSRYWRWDTPLSSVTAHEDVVCRGVGNDGRGHYQVACLRGLRSPASFAVTSAFSCRIGGLTGRPGTRLLVWCSVLVQHTAHALVRTE
jgi:hypothetical protein